MGTPSYFGSASTPADNGANGATPITITPPASMSTGDLVVIVASLRSASIVTYNATVTTTGGQAWQTLQQATISIGNTSFLVYWCRFNGTWSANPAVEFESGATGGCSAIMHVFRPSAGSLLWELDVRPAVSTWTTTASPSIAGPITIEDETVSLAIWATGNVSPPVTWSGLSGTGWVVAGTAQYRNTSGSDHTAAAAYKLQSSPGDTGTVTYTASSSCDGATMSVAFAAVAASTWTTDTVTATGTWTCPAGVSLVDVE